MSQAKPPQRAKQPAGRTAELTVSVEEPQRIDRIVCTLTGRSRAEARALIQAGAVRLAGQQCREPGTIAEVGTVVVVDFDPSRRYREKKAHGSSLFDVLFEDNHLLVIDKRAGFLTMPTEKEERISLLAAVERYLKLRGSRAHGPSLVHRLDRDTSGILVIAKHPNLAKSLKEQFAGRKPKRRYVAYVRGVLTRKSGTFRSFLATDEDLNQFSTKNEERGKLAITHYEVVRRYVDCTRVDVRLETGRRNQIRVHFSEDGHPVIGDRRYQTDLAAHPFWPWPRLALHAAELGFVHPVSKKELHFTSPLPEEFLRFEKAMGEGKLPANAAANAALGLRSRPGSARRSAPAAHDSKTGRRVGSKGRPPSRRTAPAGGSRRGPQSKKKR